MPTRLPEDYDSESHTGAQLSTFRNTDSVSIHGGSFSMTSTTAEQRTHMDSGKLHLHGLKLTPICVYSKGRQPQVHNGNTSGPHRSSRCRDQRRPYSRDLYPRHTRQNGYDPEPSLTSGASARSEQHRMPTTAASPTTLTNPR